MTVISDESTTDPGSTQVIPAVVPGALTELRANDISAWFGDHKVLDRVSLTMPAGKVTSL
nr:phosphate transporter ATP-binding protein [Aeromicrobium sp.]